MLEKCSLQNYGYNTIKIAIDCISLNISGPQNKLTIMFGETCLYMYCFWVEWQKSGKNYTETHTHRKWNMLCRLKHSRYYKYVVYIFQRIYVKSINISQITPTTIIKIPFSFQTLEMFIHIISVSRIGLHHLNFTYLLHIWWMPLVKHYQSINLI